MAIQLGSAYGKVIIDSSGVAAGVGSAVKSLGTLQAVAGQVGQTLTQVGRAMTIGLTLPILAVGAASIKAASDYEEAKNKALVVFGEMSDGIIESSNRAAQSLGVSKKEYLDYAATVGAALTAGGMGIKEATDLSEQAVKHFADLASFHNSTIQDAALAWNSAIRGQFEPIQRFFPFITDSYLKTYGTANGMLDANTKTLTANQRAMILNAIALDEKLNPALDDFAETADGFANSTRKMQAEMKNALITLGKNFLPIALQVVNGLNKMLEAFNNAPPFVQKAIIGFMLFLAVLGPILSVVGTVISAISGLVTIAGGLGISMATVTATAGAAGSALLAIGSAALTALGSILLLAIGPVILYLAFKNNFMGITDTAKQLWFIIKFYFSEGWAWLVNAVKGGGTMVMEWFKRMIDRIVAAFKNINWAQIGRNMILGIINGLLGGLPALVVAAARVAQSALNAIKSKLGISSPSAEFMKLGAFSGQGFQQGLAQTMDPNLIARAMAKPVQNMTSQQNTRNTIHMANGLTLRDLDEMMNRKIDKFTLQLNNALGGG